MPRDNRFWNVTTGSPATSWTFGDYSTGRVVSRHVADDWLVTLWTDLGDSGRRQVREVDIAPVTTLADRDPSKALDAAARLRWRRWDEEPAPTVALSGRFFRETPLGGFLAEQQASIAADEAALAHLSGVSAQALEADAPGLPFDQFHLIPLLRTAEAYVRLVAAGDRRPAKSWAETSGLSVRTVQDRIRRARAAGLLTDVPTGSAGEAVGQLTDEGKALLRRLHNTNIRVV